MITQSEQEGVYGAWQRYKAADAKILLHVYNLEQGAMDYALMWASVAIVAILAIGGT
jgi:hypothetical protein